MKPLKKNLVVFLVYCSPCFLALSIFLIEYGIRLYDINQDIMEISDRVKADSDQSSDDEYYKDHPKEMQLENFFKRKNGSKEFDETQKYIPKRIRKIWFRNSIVISIMALLPFILIGFRLAFNKDIAITDGDRFKISYQNWPMKLILACVMVLGWMYILNPSGRGATTFDEYFIMERVVESRTVPVYIASKEISPVLAGFLGWYLYLLQYFFRKLYFNDVTGTRVYRFLFGKFLFTYGIALVSSGIELEMPIAMFLIGFFPLSALTIIKEYGLKAAKGLGEGNAPLSELPGISTWYILRLEEEGVDDLTTLAGCDSNMLKKALPKIMIPYVDIWVDVAQLFAILGGDGYQKIKSFCRTASVFISNSDDPQFRLRLKEGGVENPQEIVDILKRTFKSDPNPKK